MAEEKMCVVGAGLVGSLLAAKLAQKGYQVDLYERRVDLRTVDISAGRSINLALSDRGIKALKMVGAEKAMGDISIPMHGRMLHDKEGNEEMMPYGKKGQFINSISRGHLNMHLMDLAEESEKVNLYFHMKCLDVDLDKAKITFKNEKTGDVEEKQYDRIFGTDGAFSAIRSKMMLNDRFNYSQHYIPSGYKELTMPPVEGKKWAIDKGALHIWPRGSFMMIALPNLDGSFTCTIFMPFEGEVAFNNIKNNDDVMHFFETYFKDAIPHMPTLLQDWWQNKTSSLVTIRCEPWNYKDKVLLMGDASHAIVPFYGQGMNSGFEDVSVFNELMEKHDDWGKLFEDFSNTRKPDADAISELALRNYVEMRDLVADPHFVKKRALSGKINELFPNQWLPLYSMVTFSHMRYSHALNKGDWQDGVLEKLVNAGLSSDSSEDAIRSAVATYLN